MTYPEIQQYADMIVDARRSADTTDLDKVKSALDQAKPSEIEKSAINRLADAYYLYLLDYDIDVFSVEKDVLTLLNQGGLDGSF